MVNGMSLRLQIVSRSLWIHPAMAGGCNGCHLEILACLSPSYDLERYGVRFASCIRRADAILISGSMTHRNLRRMKQIHLEMQKPGLVVAVGTCALGHGIFEGGAVVSKPVDAILPVDLYIPGCPPKPEAVISGLGKLIQFIRLQRS
jgi:Ni,Fe-hydrogenase III small subunit